jgi:hypothetical protein
MCVVTNDSGRSTRNPRLKEQGKKDMSRYAYAHHSIPCPFITFLTTPKSKKGGRAGKKTEACERDERIISEKEKALGRSRFDSNIRDTMGQKIKGASNHSEKSYRSLAV